MKLFKTILYWLLSCSWGIIMTLIGAFGAVYLLFTGHKPKRYKGAVYFECGGPSWGGVNFGPFFFVDTKTNKDIITHEWGHSIQNIVFGPFMPFLVGIPSIIRYHYRSWLVNSKRKTYNDLTDYDSIWFEGWATHLGNKYYKEGDYINDK